MNEKPKRQLELSSNPELNRLLEEYKRAYETLSEEEKKAFQRNTAIDFAYSNLVCTGRRPSITREMVAEAYDRKHNG